VRAFAGDRTRRWTGVIVPGAAALLLLGILAVALIREDPAPRVFIAAAAIIGLPLAVLRGRSVRRLPPGGGNTIGSHAWTKKKSS
jgi:hypothetical protein